jgi:predicted transcriptional regulator
MADGDLSPQFSKGEEEIADLFWDIGLKKNSARVLVLMIRDIDLTSRDMERICDLRQPEVSIALTDLMKRKWIDVVRQIMEKKGRPVKIYHLVISLEDILEELKGIIVGDYGRKILEIERVREMIKEQIRS